MACRANGLAEMASINLQFALVEITSIGDPDSVLRALDHIRQAQCLLTIVAAEHETLPDDAEAA